MQININSFIESNLNFRNDREIQAICGGKIFAFLNQKLLTIS